MEDGSQWELLSGDLKNGFHHLLGFLDVVLRVGRHGLFPPDPEATLEDFFREKSGCFGVVAIALGDIAIAGAEGFLGGGMTGKTGRFGD